MKQRNETLRLVDTESELQTKSGFSSVMSQLKRFPIKLTKAAYWFVCVLLTFHFFALTWIFFRCHTLDSAWTYTLGLCGMNQVTAGSAVVVTSAELIDAGWRALVLLFLIDLPQRLQGSHTALLRWPFVPRVLVLGGLAVMLLLIRRYHDVAFAYFQF